MQTSSNRISNLAIFSRQVFKINYSHILILSAIAFLTIQSTMLVRAWHSTSRDTLKHSRMSVEISIHAAGRGNPSLNLADGRDVVTAYEGDEELARLLEQNQARPLSLASADFDEDGVADLISGYAGQNQGVFTLHRGNVDSIYPNTLEAKQRKAEGAFSDSPFLSPAFVFAAAEDVDFLGAGDFDGDGHSDIASAARGSNKLYLLPGDGRGRFQPAQQLELPGNVTALVVGEINRRDGLDDLIVAVTSDEGSKALVFEGPGGALKASPEIFDLAAEASSMAVGQLDDGYEIDLAIAAGSELMIVHGRDRKLSLDERMQAEVRRATIGRRSFDFTISSIALGNFKGDQRTDIALLTDGAVHWLAQAESRARKSGRSALAWESGLLARVASGGGQLVCARVSSEPVDNLLVAQPNGRNLQVLSPRAEGDGLVVESALAQATDAITLASLDVDGAVAATLPMRLNRDALNDLVILRGGNSRVTVALTEPRAVFTVTNAFDSGPGSLRQAILDANNRPGADTITFAFPGGGAQIIAPFSQLPDITDALTIDGLTQSDQRVQLSGIFAGPDAVGLKITSGNSRVRGLVINGFDASGISLRTNGNNIIENNFIGTDPTGAVDLGNRGNGIFIRNSSNNLIGGTANNAGNLISGNGFPGIFIGGTPADTKQNVVQANFIGTDISGTAAMPNTGGGIILGGAAENTTLNTADNTIGGTAARSANLISGNDSSGITINNNSSVGNLVQHNFIGTNADGTAKVANTGNGIFIFGAFRNTIGGTILAAANVISGNDFPGIFIGDSNSVENLIQGNLIGTDRTGTAAIANANGVRINVASRNTIGGAVTGAGNLISGNTFAGIALSGSNATGNQIQGNHIGTDPTGEVAIANLGPGVLLGGFIVNTGEAVIAQNTLIGGKTPGTANLISGNDGPGISIINFGCTGNVVQGNLIGTNLSGTRAVANLGSGVFITNAPDNIIGAAVFGEMTNLISGNRDHGVAIGIRKDLDGRIVTGGTGISVLRNIIGTDITLMAPLPNGLNGIFVDADSVRNTIEGNLIAFNGRNGICIPNNNNPGVRINMTANFIAANNDLGIDLGDPGLTPNDDKDPDGGANEQQNFPVLNSVSALRSDSPAAGKVSPAATATITGTFNSAPNSRFTLEFFLTSSCPNQGPQTLTFLPVLLGSNVVTTDANGNAPVSFTFTFPAGIPGGFVNSSATSVDGNTSELSSCVAVTNLSAPRVTSASRSGKKLFVFGDNFENGAKILVNGVEQKTTFNSATQLTGKKAGKKIKSGDRITINNPDGSGSNVLVFP